MTPRRLPEMPRHALAHLRAADPALEQAIDRVGAFRLPRRPATLHQFCQGIIGQQLSMVAAARIGERFSALCGGEEATPEGLLSLAPEDLRAAGLSRAKVQTVASVAKYWQKKELDPPTMRSLPDEELIAMLTSVKGVGPWTVKMFLIFCLARPNVLPQEDLGLRAGLRALHGLPQMPTVRETLERTRHWAPWSTVGTWYTWEWLKAAN